MVRFTLKRSLREDSCCRVDVMNGATGLRRFSRVATDATVYPRHRLADDPLAVARSRSRASRRFALTKRAFSTGGFFAGRLTSMRPVFALLERADLPLALDNQTQRDGLHTTGRQAAADLVPQQRGNFVADQAVENTASLLRFDEVDVHCQRFLECFLDGVLRDLVEHHAEDLGPVFA